MRTILLNALFLVLSFTLKSQIIHTNGSVVTNVGNGNAGANTSCLAPGYTVYGFGINQGASQRVADNFTVPVGEHWVLTGANFYGYQTGSSTTATINDLRVQIWKGRPDMPGSTIVFGDFNSSRLTSAGFSGTYRLDSILSPLTDVQRPIMRVSANINTVLLPGEYWIAWSMGGTLLSGPWGVPAERSGFVPFNAIQSVDAGVTWANLLDGVLPMDLAFDLVGDRVLQSNRFNVAPIANFAYDEGIDTVWLNSPFNFVNTSSEDSVRYWDIAAVPGTRQCETPGFGCYLDNTRNYRRTFTQTGEYLVKLVVGNKIGKDSIVKRIVVANQTRKPQAQFYFDKQTMGIGQQVQGYDYSHYGPTGWEWRIKPGGGINEFVPNASSPTPLFFGKETGNFEVCLVVWNPIGTDSICKPAHMEVTSGNTMCMGDSVSSDLSGYIYSNRGPVDSYDPTAMSNCSYFINPCATELTAYIEKFKLRRNDSISFFDGGPTGTLIRKIGGSNITTSQRSITAATGRLYVKWHLNSVSPINGGDSGFVMRWASTGATYTIPNALFTCADTIYSTQNIIFSNQSSGSGLLEYTWDANGDGVFGDFTARNGANWTFTSSTPLQKNICLKVTNCKGTGQYCKLITVLPIVQRPEAVFVSDMQKGFTTDKFRLIDQTRNGVGSWQWTVTPSADVSYLEGTTSSSQNPVIRLAKTGFYSVTLTVGNTEGSHSLTRTNYIEVLRYEEPNTEYPIASGSDIGITRVVFADLDTITPLKTPVFDKIYEKKIATVYRGVNYTVTVARNTAQSAMERKIWIDRNFDGLFNGTDEEILNEHMNRTALTTAHFMIPNDIEPGRMMRLRVGISEGNTTLTPDKATSGCFEDYGAVIGTDTEKPTLELVGSPLYRVEINKAFVDPWVIATDNREGNISNRVERITDLDTSKAGIYTIKYTVKDLYGNVSDTVYRTVQMEVNRTGPVITLNGPDTQYVEVYSPYTEAGATAKDNTGASLDGKLEVSGTVNDRVLGTYYVTYKVTDQFDFTATKVRVVIVRDTEAPFIGTTYGGPVIRHQIGTAYTDNNMVLRDNYYAREELTVTRTGSINTGKEGTYYFNYKVCDPSGNCTSDYFVQVEVGDTIAPMAQLLGDNPYTTDVFEPFTDPGVIATDNYYSQASLITIKTHNIDIGTLGSYRIDYTVRDGAGNQTQLSRQVIVADRKGPSIELLGGNPFNLTRFKDYEEPGFKITDNYYSHEDLEGLVRISSSLGVRNDTLWGEMQGWKYVRYQVTDPSGNTSELVERQVRVTEITGLWDHDLSRSVRVYPNPSKGLFTLTFEDVLKERATLSLYNALGAKVYSQELGTGTTHEVQAPELQAGIYLVQVNTGKDVWYQKIVIE